MIQGDGERDTIFEEEDKLQDRTGQRQVRRLDKRLTRIN